MIKLIAFDLVGVLVREKDIELSTIEDKLERLFGPNLSDEEYLKKASFIAKNENAIDITNKIINKLYEPREENLLSKIKNECPNVKIIIATNHVSYIKQYIEKTFPEIDDIIISAEINKIKPNFDFYEYILDKYEINPDEMLFLDDNKDNVLAAESLTIPGIVVSNSISIYDEIIKRIF